MPATDKFHHNVIRALEKDAWKIIDEQVALPVDGRNLWVDIEAINELNEQVILVEIKGFEILPRLSNIFSN